ncbi:hypothetical protein DOY81_005581 [Sarcophaga bullata]|nr:hypothetical protein DOY81_005581 [Sarcophaga bullata]
MTTETNKNQTKAEKNISNEDMTSLTIDTGVFSINFHRSTRRMSKSNCAPSDPAKISS